jgi:hypothetical protein
MSQTTQQASGPFDIGIDFHKHYSVFCVIDDRNTIMERGRIDHKIPIGFEFLIKRYPGCRVVFETTMNWHWLYETGGQATFPFILMQNTLRGYTKGVGINSSHEKAFPKYSHIAQAYLGLNLDFLLSLDAVALNRGTGAPLAPLAALKQHAEEELSVLGQVGLGIR